LLVGWVVVSTLCLGVFGTRAAYYLLPLLPALVLMGAGFSPLLRGKPAWFVCGALIVWFGVQADYKPSAVATASALDRYSQLRRGNELLIVSIDDEFYASVLDLPKVRYVYLTPLDATKTSEFFYRLGMILSSEEFCSLPRLMPVYEQRLRAWKLPGALHPEGTLIDSGSPSKLADIIRCSPDRDFLIRGVAVADHDHVVMAAPDQMVFLLAKKSSRRDPASIAPGTVVPNSRQ
jgi:hypothetical protein